MAIYNTIPSDFTKKCLETFFNRFDFDRLEALLTGIGKPENTRTKDSIHKIENCQKEIYL